MSVRGLAEVEWHLELVTDPGVEPVTLAFVRDQHLRVTNGTAEDDWITKAIKTARRMAERSTRRALSGAPQIWQLLMDGFPCGEFEVPKSPFIEARSLSYVDADGVTQELDADAYQVSAPVGPQAARGRLAPAYNTVWPTTRAVMDAVTLEFSAGYVRPGSPQTADVPDDIVSGILLVVGELYKQRTLSADSVQNSPGMLSARNLWMDYRAY